MTPLDLFKDELYEKFSITPRSLAPIEIADLQQEGVLEVAKTKQMYNFPLPLPKWDGLTTQVGHVLKAWALNGEGCLTILAELPGHTEEYKVHQLNRRIDLSGRHYVANSKGYYLNTQIIFPMQCKDHHITIDLNAVRAARKAEKYLVEYMLIRTIRDLSLSLHLSEQNEPPCGSVCSY